jgi:hypothetical protein
MQAGMACCEADTAEDRAESQPGLAALISVEGPRNLALAEEAAATAENPTRAGL